MTENVDTHGNTVEDAKEQEPLLDLDAPAASEEIPTGGEDVMVLAQTPEEVEAQRRGGDHSQNVEDMDEDVAFGNPTAPADESNDGLGDGEADETWPNDPNPDDEETPPLNP